MKLIAQNFKGRYKEVILGPLFKLLEAVLELLVPLVMADIIDVGVRNGDRNYILHRAILLVLLAVACIVSAMVCQYFAAVAAGQFGYNLRKQMYSHVLQLSPKEMAYFGKSGLITRLTNDTNQIQTGVNMLIRLASRAPFLAIGSIVLAMMLNWKIGLLFLCSTPIIIAVLYAIMKRSVPQYGEIQKGQDVLSGIAAENLEGVRVIRAFSRQKQEMEEFDAAANRLSAITIQVGKISAALNPITSVVVAFAIVGIIWMGAGFANSGSMQAGAIIALVTYMNQTLLALIVFANLIVLFTKAVASTKRITEVLLAEPSIQDGAGATDHPRAPALQFKMVGFAYYANAENALASIDFSIEKGETIGVIGGTGSGKSTLVHLIVRHYDAQEGGIFLNGNDVRQYTLQELREKVAVVAQTAALFSGTIRHNLSIASPHATEEEMWHALTIAQAAGFIQKMPQKLDSYIEEGGRNFSGGQRQRLTIARALLRKPQLLILDDSSSALDYATDAALRRALEVETKGTTKMIISQRASTIRNADKILVLEDGRMAGLGNHQALLQNNAVYKDICASQGIS